VLWGVGLDQPLIELPGLEILAEVGRGPTGVVYRAQDLPINRLVALKVLLLGSAAERHVRAARFLREARVLACLMPHANIPAIHAVMESQGQTYYTREFVQGTTLKARVDARAIRESEGIQVLAGIEAALARVHEQGIVHRNLYPENVLVANDGTAKLIGFSGAAAIDTLVRHGTPTVVLEADMQALRTLRDWMFSRIG
jgi:serine/threonine protein kinase